MRGRGQVDMRPLGSGGERRVDGGLNQPTLQARGADTVSAVAEW